MTIGTPYNFTETNIKNKSVMLADFIAGKKNIPSTLHVYSVAGTITYDSDELVPDASVSAGKYIYQNQAKSYTEITVTGEMLSTRIYLPMMKLWIWSNSILRGRVSVRNKRPN